MKLTASQLAQLRSRPHQTQLYLSIYRPKTLMAAQVMSGTYSTGDIQIQYMNVSTGTYLNLYPDLTVLVGTNPGESDYGRIRMRSATGTYILFAENAINWNQGQYLTFIDQIDIQAIYPRIIQDPNNQTNVIFYKDYNIPYSNQNQIYGTFINAGPHRAGFINSGTFFFSATGSHNVNDDSLTWSWIFEGGNPTGSTAFTPGLVQWNTPGHYKVRIRSTSSSGAVDDAYRYVSMYDRPGQGNNPPINRWELQSLNGSRSEGGYTASFKVYDNIGDVQPNAVVVMFGETSYGGVNENLGGNAINNSGIYYVGYILGDSIKFNYEYSYVEFTVGSVTEMMKNAEGFSVSCESKASPTTWFELYEMTVERAIYHYLRWHSTVLRVTDFQYLGDNRLVQYFDADRGSLYDAIDSFVRDGMLGETISDRQGKIWAEVSSFGLTTPLSSIPDGMNFDRQDWMNDPTVEERRNYELSFIELGGIAYYGVSSNTFSALLSNAPSTVPLYHGKADRKEGMILASQTQINQVAGNYLAHNNTQFPNVSISIAGCYTNLDIVPQEKNYLILTASDTIRNKSLQNLPYIVSGMEWKYSPVQESFYPDITLLQIATGTAGVTVEIPVTPPDYGFTYPSLNLPPLPDFPNSPGVGSTIPTIVVMHDTDVGFIYTQNFDSDNPQWLTMNNGLTSSQYQQATWFFICPNGVLYCGNTAYSSGATADVGQFIARCPQVGGAWTIIYDYTLGHVEYPGVNALGISYAGFNPNLPESVAFCMGYFGNCNMWIGSGGTFTKKVSVTNAFNNAVRVSYGATTWRMLGIENSGVNVNRWWIFNADCSSISSSGKPPSDMTNDPFQTLPVNGQDIIYALKSGNVSYRITHNFTLYTSVPFPNNTQGIDGIDCDVSGNFVMARWDVGGKGHSSDQGTTWTALPNLPPAINWYFAYSGSAGSLDYQSRWIAVAGANIRFSPDFGNTWLNREGDILSVNPTPAINIIKAII